MRSAGILALLFTLLLISAVIAQAAAPVCQTCGVKIVGPAVTLKADKTYSYNCVVCALIDAERHPDGVITARSPNGQTVTLTRKGTAWTASPAGAVVFSTGGHDANCQQHYPVFTDRGQAAAYAKKHPAAQGRIIALTDTAAVVEAARPQMPAQATCPVMKSTFKPTTKNTWTIRDGKTYYFCCPSCKKQFNHS